jgi:NSS family neurotransmitter:Na+ symporter
MATKQVQGSGTFSKIGFILATAGSAVGLGNVIRFPYVMGDSGGGAFFVIYLLTILFIGAAVMLAEMLVGYLGQAGAVSSMEKLTTGNPRPWRFIGWVMSSSSNVIFSYYVILLAWMITYIILSATGGLAHDPKAADAVFTATRENLLHSFLLSVLLIVVTFGIVARGISKGIERLNLVLMPAILFFFGGMFIYAVTLDGFGDALDFMFKFKWSEITMHVVVSAIGMSFFTLSLGSAIVLAYSASLPRGSNLVQSIGYVVVLDTLIAIVSGLMIFSFVFTYGGNPSAGFGLVFITLGTVFSNLGILGQFLGVVFFTALFFAGITSAVSMVEPMLKAVHYRFNMSRTKSAVVLAIPTALLTGIIILSFGGYFGDVNLMDVVDYFLSNVLLPLGGLAITIFVGWFMDKEVVRDGVAGKLGRIFEIWYMIIKYIAPLLIIIVMLSLLGVM